MSFTYKFDCSVKNPLITIKSNSIYFDESMLSWLKNYLHSKPNLQDLQKATNIIDMVIKEYPAVKDSSEYVLLVKCDYQLSAETINYVSLELKNLTDDDCNYIVSHSNLDFIRLKKMLLPFL